MKFSPLVDQLIEAMRCLPGVGNKTAQRMVFQLLSRQREQGKFLAETLLQAMHHVQHCKSCRIFTEHALCSICSNQHRDQHSLCIVENPIDVLLFEQTGSYKGLYFVLHGKLSPLDGIGPRELGLPLLMQRLSTDTPALKEMILAISPTVEGETTAHYITEQTKHLPITISRIAHGVPIGSELEYIDISTLTHAFLGRGTL